MQQARAELPGGPPPPGGDMSPEQMVAMLEQLQAAGHDLDQISPDLSELLRNVKKKVGDKTADDVPTEEIEPEPGFVVKTADVATGTKVFINVCSHGKVPAPGTGWSAGVVPPEVQNALARRDEDGGGDADMEHLRFPLSAGQPKTDMDKKGERCVTVDCILNTDVLTQAKAFRPLKAFLVELCINWVAQKTKMQLDEKFKLPKMRYKGDVIERQNIRVDRKPLVSEVRDVPDEPAFPLIISKLDKEKAAERAAAAAAAAAAKAASRQAPGGGGGGVSSSGASVAGASIAGGVASLASNFNFSGKQVMTHAVEYVGRPVERVTLTVTVPQTCGRPQPPVLQAATSTSGRGAAPVRVAISGHIVHVSADGCYDLSVPLLFGVAAGGTSGNNDGDGSCEYDEASGTLVCRLRYVPLGELLAAAREEKPLPFGQLGLGTDSLMELE